MDFVTYILLGVFAVFVAIMSLRKGDPDKGKDYEKRLAEFRKGYKKAIDKKAWADKCMDCEECLKKCPQQIRIPNQMERIVELLG